MIETGRIFKNRLYVALVSCGLVTESQSTSDNICLDSWRVSLFIFPGFINVSVLCLSVLVALEIRNTGKWFDISDFHVPVFISVCRKLSVFVINLSVYVVEKRMSRRPGWQEKDIASKYYRHNSCHDTLWLC